MLALGGLTRHTVARGVHPEPNVVLPIFCAHCGGAVDVRCEFDDDIDNQRIGEYDCPYCEKPNVFRLPGRILWATANPEGTSWPRIVRDRPQ